DDVTPMLGNVLHQDHLVDVAKAIAKLPEAAKAGWHFEYSYKSTGSTITDVDLTLTLYMKMPEWSKYSSASEKEQMEWDRFLRALRFHEDGHHDLCRREAKTVYDTLSEAKTLKALKSAYDSEIARVQGLSDAYDDSVDHGKTQTSLHGTTIIKA